MESIFNKEKVNFDELLGKPLNDVLDSLYKKLSPINFTRYYIELFELDSSERKFFMVYYYLDNTLMHSKIKEELISDEIKEFIENLDCCYYIYNPYKSYICDFLKYYYSDKDIYPSLFCYEVLTKLNVLTYSNYILRDTKNFSFRSYHSITIFINILVSYFMSHGFDKKDQELFNKYLDLNDEFPLIYFDPDDHHYISDDSDKKFLLN
ncbi:hypothetical protein PIROE2DRAFT_5906 [Piromyces sp. E2]|nr:hypothetical protein PIROE2DRAFT_5906 [Piromyces sp. E2]|eukprot:OUM66806.1 hypothetical protein PIROE2DRAFT_5906 [Piromyces sp. E2]